MNLTSEPPVYFLLVDDLEENLLALEALLRRDGLVILKARSGTEALEILLKHEVALALLDVQMPGMDGFELAELIRGHQRLKHVPIIFVTAGSTDQQRRFRGYEAGAVDFLQKPIEADILRSKAKVFFDLYQQRQLLLQQNDILRSIAEANTRLLMESRHQAGMLQLAQRAGGVGVFSVDIDENMMEVSPEFCELFGLPVVAKIRPEEVELCVLEEDRNVCSTTETRDQGSAALEVQYRIRRQHDGEMRWIARRAQFIHDDHGNAVRMIGVVQDMTRQQHAQQALVEARNEAEAANVAKTEFLANMSHEIRTPMNAVIGLANILSESSPLTEKQRDYLKTLQMSADALLALLNDLLDIAKIEARTVELEQVPFDLGVIIEDVAGMMQVRAKEKGLSLHVEKDCVEGRVFVGDPTRLRQILLNLCSNAVKFTERGEIYISATCEPSALSEQEHITITVRDSGIGIPADKLHTIFQKFTQADTSINRKYGGTGLGLAITKTLAEIMGGTISVSSEIDKGSVFTLEVVLPWVDNQPSKIAAPPSNDHSFNLAANGGGKGRVLLVEDYAANVLVAKAFLQQFGYDVEVAENGTEAVNYVSDQDHNFLLALMDVQMHGMNGLEATQRIRAIELKEGRTRLPIIGMTAHALAGDREKCLEAGMDDYISKPFHPDELRQLLIAYEKKAVFADE